MNTKKTFLQLLGFGLLFVSSNAALARSFMLKNNSFFDIAYSYNDAAELNRQSAVGGKLLSAGQTIQIPDGQKVAIMRSGLGSNVVSSWVSVPNPDQLATQTLNAHKIGFYWNSVNAGNLPFVYIGTGYTGGWDFSIGY